MRAAWKEKFTPQRRLPSVGLPPTSSFTIPGKSGEGFGKNGIDPSPLAGGNHLVKIIPFLHAGTGKSFVCKDAGQLPIGVFLDFLCIVGFLCLIAVDLFLIVGAHSAVSRYSLFAML